MLALLAPYAPVLAAPFVGSFLGTCVVRGETGESPFQGRSHCDSCGHKLGVLDLVPIFGWLAVGGTCRYCRTRIAPFHLAVELATLFVATWAVATLGGEAWAGCALGWTLVALAAADLRSFVLPDLLSLPLVALGLAVTGLVEPAAIVPHAIGAAAGFAAFAVIGAMYRRLRGQDGLGGGDAKLLAAGGAWVGWQGLPDVVLIAAATLAGLAARAAFGAAVARDERVPFGPGLCLGIWLVFLYRPFA